MSTHQNTCIYPNREPDRTSPQLKSSEPNADQISSVWQLPSSALPEPVVQLLHAQNQNLHHQDDESCPPIQQLVSQRIWDNARAAQSSMFVTSAMGVKLGNSSTQSKDLSEGGKDLNQKMIHIFYTKFFVSLFINFEKRQKPSLAFD